MCKLQFFYDQSSCLECYKALNIAIKFNGFLALIIIQLINLNGNTEDGLNGNDLYFYAVYMLCNEIYNYA